MGRRPKGTGGITQRKDGLWVGRVDAGWTPQGTRRRIQVSSRSKAKAQDELLKLVRKINAGQVAAAPSARLTVKAWSTEWLEMHATRVRPTTYTTDAGTVRKWIVPTIGHRRLKDLTPADLRALRTKITDAGRSTTTALHAHKILVKMLKDAIVEGHTVPERVLLAPKPSKAANDRNAIPLDQLLKVLKVVGERDDAARWVSAILQGMRQGETLGLEWSRIDLKAKTVDVSWQLQRLPLDHEAPDGWEARHLVGAAWLTRPKTRAGQRILPLVPWMHATLSAARETWQPNQWDLVWINAEKGEPIRDYEDRATWHAIQEEAEVGHPSERPWHLHECRHATATLLLRLGVDRAVIEAILGQAVLVESYLHTDLSDALGALNKVAEQLHLEPPAADG